MYEDYSQRTNMKILNILLRLRHILHVKVRNILTQQLRRIIAFTLFQLKVKKKNIIILAHQKEQV